jgi:hypothetical protein
MSLEKDLAFVHRQYKARATEVAALKRELGELKTLQEVSASSVPKKCSCLRWLHCGLYFMLVIQDRRKVDNARDLSGKTFELQKMSEDLPRQGSK